MAVSEGAGVSRDLPTERKLLGAFYTPPVLSDFLVAWAVRQGGDRVVEPAAGEAVFLVGAARRLMALGAPGELVERNLVGYDIDSKAAESASRVLDDELGIRPRVEVSDFFDVPIPAHHELFDVAIGNPPWIRYHHFEGAAREQAQRIAVQAGVTLSGLASSWAAFVVHAASLLKPDGRLAFVLPAELLSTDYAEPIREFLKDRFHSVRVIAFRERVFPGALVDAVLLTAEGQGPGVVKVVQVQNADDLATAPSGTATEGAGKWSRMLLPPDVASIYVQAVGHSSVRQLGSAMTVDIGVVTGANEFFVVDAKTRKKYGLARDTTPVLPKGVQLGVEYTDADWRIGSRAGQRAWFFVPRAREGAAERYIEWGEEQGFDQSYKSKARKDWWRIRSFPPPDFFLGYMAHRAPRFAANSAKAGSTNLVHQVRVIDPIGIPSATLAAGFYNSLTLLSAELEGRAYGGGVLKLETKEAERLALPLDVDRSVWGALDKRVKLIDAAVRSGDFEAAADLVDPILLGSGLSMSGDDRAALRSGWDVLRSRREARGRSKRD